ncbi:MAG: NADH-quinone oxidoreductase subunit NuoF [Candidatus Sumerlaeia bacterium]|nr:NADH-quinone oxidoreductase subunit NuoF [Candidatus Sumerlaeia bacterium]
MTVSTLPDLPALAEFERVFLPNIEEDKTETLEEYLKVGGYEAVKIALAKKPEEITEIIKDSGLRGRGGAGFPTGMKWSFLPKGAHPRYLTINADESEPGTCKDRPLMEQRPHTLIEGIICSCIAIESEKAFIYIRGEYYKSAKVMQDAVDEAYAAGILGDNVMGSGKRVDVVVHRGAGAYICGEETALLTSLEGYRGYPKLKPPFPAIKGLYDKPTIINNVETIVSVGWILKKGADWFKKFTHERSTGQRLLCVSGHVKKPGVYELPMTLTLREIIYDVCGGMRNDHDLKFIIPGGSSVPWVLPEHLDATWSMEGLAAVGSSLGSAGMMVMDHTVCPVWALANLSAFYRHESCGQCTPCREGSAWLQKIVMRIERGEGEEGDLETLRAIAGTGPNTGMICGKSICALGDAAAWPVSSALNCFWDDFEEHIKTKGCKYKNKRYWMQDDRFVNETYEHKPSWGHH